MTLKDSVFCWKWALDLWHLKRIPNMCNFHVARNHQTRGIALAILRSWPLLDFLWSFQRLEWWPSIWNISPGFRTDSPQQIGFPAKLRAGSTKNHPCNWNLEDLHEPNKPPWLWVQHLNFPVCFHLKTCSLLKPLRPSSLDLEESKIDRSNRGIESNGVAEVQPVNGERPY